jgi:Na+/proline symporter
MLIGGFFLYISYYGTDQSQVQRELTVGNVNDVRKSLLVNAFGRFPLVFLYCVMGIFVGAVISQPEMLLQVAETLNLSPGEVRGMLSNDPDRMVPMFILTFLPHGIIGFIFVAIMAALMSSLDSGLNSLSAVTMRDFYQKFIRTQASDKHYLIVSKLFTLGWGIFCVTAALIFYELGEATRQTTIVLINAVGSMLYGPILAAFLMGMLTRKVSAPAMKLGILAGIFVNILLWLYTEISWLWWNVTGFLISAIVALLISVFLRINVIQIPTSALQENPAADTERTWFLIYVSLVAYFFLIILISYFIQVLGV